MLDPFKEFQEAFGALFLGSAVFSGGWLIMGAVLSLVHRHAVKREGAKAWAILMVQPLRTLSPSTAVGIFGLSMGLFLFVILYLQAPAVMLFVTLGDTRGLGTGIVLLGFGISMLALSRVAGQFLNTWIMPAIVPGADPLEVEDYRVVNSWARMFKDSELAPHACRDVAWLTFLGFVAIYGLATSQARAYTPFWPACITEICLLLLGIWRASGSLAVRALSKRRFILFLRRTSAPLDERARAALVKAAPAGHLLVCIDRLPEGRLGFSPMANWSEFQLRRPFHLGTLRVRVPSGYLRDASGARVHFWQQAVRFLMLHAERIVVEDGPPLSELSEGEPGWGVAWERQEVALKHRDKAVWLTSQPDAGTDPNVISMQSRFGEVGNLLLVLMALFLASRIAMLGQPGWWNVSSIGIIILLLIVFLRPGLRPRSWPRLRRALRTT